MAGLDEAGRGAWAGPVVAAAVIFKPHTYIPEIDDSKKIPPDKREALFEVIVNRAESFGIGCVGHAVIDEANILRATIQAMVNAVSNLGKKPEYLLIDGNRGIGLPVPQQLLVRGDSLSMTIGAASILAKVTRDRMMVELEKNHPQFKFSKHKGYGTREHREELRRFGPTTSHRLSFEPMRSMIPKKS